MITLKKFNAFAASRGDGLHPRLRDDKSVRWYQVNVGLAKISESIIAERRLGAPAIVMTRNGVGLTLVFSARETPRLGDPQVVCFPLDGPPAPAVGSKPIFLVDPDGTSVELPSFSGW
jgi:hypothetical protein